MNTKDKEELRKLKEIINSIRGIEFTAKANNHRNINKICFQKDGDSFSLVILYNPITNYFDLKDVLPNFDEK